MTPEQYQTLRESCLHSIRNGHKFMLLKLTRARTPLGKVVQLPHNGPKGDFLRADFTKDRKTVDIIGRFEIIKVATWLQSLAPNAPTTDQMDIFERKTNA